MRRTTLNQPQRHDQRGFSLNEALISLTVLTSGLLSLAQFQGDLHQNRRQTKAQTTAINLVLDKVEELRDLAAGGEALQDGEDVPAERPGDSTRFARSWTIRAGVQPGVDEVRVVARWEGAKGEVQTTGLRTFIAP
jgi:Tfp pilus assembly protein PilV